MMMPVNRTLVARGATGTGVESPGGCAERSIEKDDRDKTERREKRAPTVLVPKGHL